MKKLLVLPFLGLFQICAAPSVDLEDTVRTLNGKIEELEHEVAQLKQRLNIIAPQTESSEISGMTAQEIASLSADDLIKKAKGLIKNDHFKEARDILNAFIQKNPKHAKLGIVHYYFAKSCFEEKNYTQAADSYMDSYQADKKGRKTAKALFKLAKCFIKLNKKDQAKATLKKLILMNDKEYSKKAEKLLKEI